MTSNLQSQHYSYKDAYEKLSLISQTHLLQYWDSLDSQEQHNLLEQVDTFDIDTFYLQKKILNEPNHLDNFTIKPFNHVMKYSEGRYLELGSDRLNQGKVGVVIVAGGQGTRFGYDGPKGCFPISVVKGKSLFQSFAEKTLCASEMSGVDLQIAIMTSSNNHDQTVQYFETLKYFGLKESQVSFFQQADLPLVDKKENLFLQHKGEIAKGPNGNGAFFEHFVDSGIWEKWNTLGIESVNFTLIDNPLADPFDLELIGCHHEHKNQVTIKCIERKDPYEKVGVIVSDEEGRVHVIEYTEIDEIERLATASTGEFVHRCANISLFCMDMGFVKTVADNVVEFMPYHLALKAASYLNEKGESVRSKSPIAHKYERFIFDMLPYAENVSALIYPREECFAPLKNPIGTNSPKTVKEALLNRDRRQWSKITFTEAPNHLFELSQKFYYPTELFKNKWAGKEAPKEEYIE